jgi:hypothetical protein
MTTKNMKFRLVDNGHYASVTFSGKIGRVYYKGECDDFYVYENIYSLDRVARNTRIRRSDSYLGRKVTERAAMLIKNEVSILLTDWLEKSK